MRPLIGITLDWMESGDFSPRPHFAVREHYFKAVYESGGMPVGIPHMENIMAEYIEKMDGVIVPGGDFALPEIWYVDVDEPAPYSPSPRLENDILAVKMALQDDTPLLGICAGMQIMGGVLGCKMTRNLHKFTGTDIKHRDGASADKIAHKVKISEGTLLKSITIMEEFDINSHHQEAIVEVSDTVKINAIAPDGVIEGIEVPGKKFAMGLEWHPEYFLTEYDKKIFSAFIKAATK